MKEPIFILLRLIRRDIDEIYIICYVMVGFKLK